MTSARETEPSGASGWKDVLPIVRLFGKSRGESLRGDVIGGISACVVMIPSVIAYADLAGLFPAHGLYAALAPMLGYAVFTEDLKELALDMRWSWDHGADELWNQIEPAAQRVLVLL